MTEQNEHETLRTELAAAKQEAAELQQVFDVRWEADMRALRRWREAHPGNDLVLPDRANLVVWLLGLVERSAPPRGCCDGERCFCGWPAEHKVEETVFADDPQPIRHPLTSYLCHQHFLEIMGPAAER
jgi:hypothetical protein